MKMRDQLMSCLNGRLDASLEMLQRMVAINSFTANRAGVDAVGTLTAEAFTHLGFKAESIPSVDARYGQHLVLTREGSSGRRVGMVTHLDTVFSREEEERNEFRWRRVGDRIYGPGILDIKGGTVMIHMVLSALREVVPEVFDSVTWVILANSSEEILSTDFAGICLERMGRSPLAALVFEPGGKQQTDASLVAARKGRATFRVTVEGRGAHAGSRHERGANAIVQMARVVERIASLTDYGKALTFNVGTVEGGTVVNRVPHLATAEVEMRAFTVETFQAGIASIMALNGQATVRSAEGGHACRLAVEMTAETPPWPGNEATDRLFGIWQRTAELAGMRIVKEERGGVSDGNYLWHTVPTLDGLGPYGDHAHCSEQSVDGSKEQEYVDASSFVPRAALHAAALARLAEEGSGGGKNVGV